MHCGVKVTESSTNKQHHIYRERSLRLHVAGLVEGSRRCWKEGSAPVPQSLCNELSAPVRETPKSRFLTMFSLSVVAPADMCKSQSLPLSHPLSRDFCVDGWISGPWGECESETLAVSGNVYSVVLASAAFSE